ncbi:response regulator transcription factor [Sulfurimonas sp.]|uniref:response regulator transcription factor n=1 Tax=Sulfurimonas sp. TaxID=2022749 RepID=UPI0039E725CF
MHSSKNLLEYSSNLNILYVEDDKMLMEETAFLLEAFFKNIDTAYDGLDGLNKYNNSLYDIVITDINMPNMNGIEMISKIKEINPEQKIIAISAHNESDILINLIQSGVNSFVLKPIIQKEVINSLYPVCRDAYTQILNIELVNQLNEKNEILMEQINSLQSKENTIIIKHQQIEKLLQKDTTKEKANNTIVANYFEEDVSENEENVIFLQDHADDILDYLQEITHKILSVIDNKSRTEILYIASVFSKISSILIHYSPYLDSLSGAFAELSSALQENTDDFIAVLEQDSDGTLILFDAINSDMERYISRFSKESMAMKNAHHIHEPTVLSIRQIISFFVPDQFEDSDIEFF